MKSPSGVLTYLREMDKKLEDTLQSWKWAELKEYAEKISKARTEADVRTKAP